MNTNISALNSLSIGSAQERNYPKQHAFTSKPVKSGADFGVPSDEELNFKVYNAMKEMKQGKVFDRGAILNILV